MTVIGDALNRADQDRRSGTVCAEVKPLISVVSETKGIAHPRQPTPPDTSSVSSFLSVALFSLAGFAVFMSLYPEWIDAIWQFQTSPALAVKVPLQDELDDRQTFQPALESGTDAGIVPVPRMQAAPITNSTQLGDVFPKDDRRLTNQREVSRSTNRPDPGGSERSVSRSITQIPVTLKSTRALFRLEGVMLGGRRRLAVVNGAIVGVGDEVDGATVRAITSNTVALEIDGRVRRIPIRTSRTPQSGEAGNNPGS
ncbi:MAG: general secretion pathway protein GspB [Planctomycetes bacterium]|nr:general secretion pathway protein GspB [Planctomycetota bacterium]